MKCKVKLVTLKSELENHLTPHDYTQFEQSVKSKTDTLKQIIIARQQRKYTRDNIDHLVKSTKNT